MAEYMKAAHQGIAGAADTWPKPAGVKTVCINQITGYATTTGGNCDIFPSWYQPRYPDSSKKAVIDTISNKLATACTPDLAKQTITGGGLLSELPTSDPLYNNFIAPEVARYGAAGGNIPSDNDNVHTCGPSGTWTDSPDLPSIQLNNTAVKSGVNTYTITGTVTQGKYALKTVNFKSSDGTVLTGGAQDVAASGPISFTYTTTSSSPTIIEAEAIDSVFYDVTSNTVTIPAAL
jgi:hypothetical protein